MPLPMESISAKSRTTCRRSSKSARFCAPSSPSSLISKMISVSGVNTGSPPHTRKPKISPKPNPWHSRINVFVDRTVPKIASLPLGKWY